MVFPLEFHPNINENSRKLMNYRSGNCFERVEERLLRQGKENINKKEISRKQFALMNDFSLEKPEIQKKTDEEMKILTERLFSYERIYREKREFLIKKEENRYCFKPEIREFTIKNRKPLYDQEKITRKPEEIPQKRRFSLGKWEEFIERNQKTLENKKNSIENSRKNLDKNEIKDCSFKPEINRKTTEILLQGNKLEKNMLKRQKEFQNKAEDQRKALFVEKEVKFKEKCTFKPKIGKKTNSPKKSLEKVSKSANTSYREISLRKTPEFSRKRVCFSSEKTSRKDLKEYKRKILEDFEQIEQEIAILVS